LCFIEAKTTCIFTISVVFLLNTSGDGGGLLVPGHPSTGCTVVMSGSGEGGVRVVHLCHKCKKEHIKGIVRRKLRWVTSGINR
jgi:hypothetical protein